MRKFIIESKFEVQQRPKQETINARSFYEAMQIWCERHDYTLRQCYQKRVKTYRVAKGYAISGSIQIILAAYTAPKE